MYFWVFEIFQQTPYKYLVRYEIRDLTHTSAVQWTLDI